MASRYTGLQAYSKTRHAVAYSQLLTLTQGILCTIVTHGEANDPLGVIAFLLTQLLRWTENITQVHC